MQVLCYLPQRYTHKPVDTPTKAALMKLIPFIIPLMAIFTPASSEFVTVTINDFYGQSGTSTNTVLCKNKLQESGFMTFGSIPDFPNIGGASDIMGPNPSACDACRQLTNPNNGKSIYAIVIDGADSGGSQGTFALPQRVFAKLADSILELEINATVGYVSESLCGL